jgi:hypothetical protein
MKSRIIWAAVLLTAIVGFYFTTIRPTSVSSPGLSRKRPPIPHLRPLDVSPPTLPIPVYETPTLRPPSPEMVFRTPLPIARPDRPQSLEVPIQNNATTDFSIGAPVIRSGNKDQEALDRALQEMAEATKDTRFVPAPK